MPSTDQGTIDAMNNGATLSKPVFLRLNSVGDAVMTMVALRFNALAADTHGEHGIAARSRALAQQIMDATPDDWDCGDPDCEACAQRRQAGDGLKRARVFEPTVEFIIDPEAGDA